LIKEAEAVLTSKGVFDAVNFTPQGPAGIFAAYKLPTANIGYLFLNEFMVDVFVAIVIYICIDPTNFMVTPSAAPWIIGLSYSVVVWSFASVGVSTNAARDFGGRLAARTIYGSKAWGGPYAAIAALTNIPATMFAYCIYEFVLKDSSRVVTEAQKEMLLGRAAETNHNQNINSSSGASTSLIEIQQKGV